MTLDLHRVMLFISQWEGKEAKVYLDTTGHRTVGIGFNLERNDAGAKLEAIGLDLDKVRQGLQTLTEDQMMDLMQEDVANAMTETRKMFLGMENFPLEAQLVLVDLVYNVGASTLRAFKNFMLAVRARRWARAALELIFKEPGNPTTTHYFAQTKRRGAHHASVLMGLDGRL